MDTSDRTGSGRRSRSGRGSGRAGIKTPRALAAWALGLAVLASAGCSGGRAHGSGTIGTTATGGTERPGPEHVTRPATQEEEKRAQEHIGPLKKSLMAALSGAMAEGGPAEAIETCRTVAPRIAADLSREGVEIGRTSHRIRNPENAARPWVVPVLAEFLERPAESSPRWVELSENRVGYVEPIHVQGLCLRCHGGEIEAPVREAIASAYPEDAAIGFATGDLRGVFWLEMPRR